jgi:hypothetical protein
LLKTFTINAGITKIKNDRKNVKTAFLLIIFNTHIDTDATAQHIDFISISLNKYSEILILPKPLKNSKFPRALSEN